MIRFLVSYGVGWVSAKRVTHQSTVDWCFIEEPAEWYRLWRWFEGYGAAGRAAATGHDVNTNTNFFM